MVKLPQSGMIRRASGTLPERQLRARSASVVPAAAVPLVHVTAVGFAREIIKAGRLEARRCKVFGKDLVYFFAGKASYGLKDGDEKSHQINRFPFVFVFEPHAVPEPYHVYPFDTGGALAGLFTAADPYVPLEDYELEPSHVGVTGHIGWAFEDLAAYLEGDLRPQILDDVPTYETVTRGFVDIARMPASGKNRPDGRAAAVEVAASHHIPLKGNLRFVVLPRQYLEGGAGDAPNDGLLAQLDRLVVGWEVYDWQANKTPNEFRDDITRLVKAHRRAAPEGER